MKRSLYTALLILVILVTAGTVYLTATESGLNWVLTLIKENVPGELSVKTANGRLIGPLQLNGISYRNDTLTVSVDSFNLNWKPLRLFVLQVYLSDLSTSGITVELRETEKPAKADEAPSEIRLPLDIKVDNLLVRDISILQSGSDAPLMVNEITLKAELDAAAIQVELLRIKTPDAGLSLHGDISMEDDYPLNIETEWTIHPEGYSQISGSGEVQGTLKTLSITQSVRSPADALLHAEVHHLLDDPDWEADISVTGLSLDKVNSSWPLSEITAKAQSTGTLSKFDIDGMMDFSENEYGNISAIFSLAREKDTWIAKDITLSIPDTEAAVSFSGTYAEIHGTGSFQAQGHWNNLSWPIQADRPDALSREGTFEVRGNPQKYNFSLVGDISGQQIPNAKVRLLGTGTQTGLKPLSLAAELLDGEVIINGAVSWEPALTWSAALDAKAINPALQWPEWPGKLNIRADAEGDMKEGKVELSVKSASVRGALRGYPVKASAVFEMADNRYRLPHLEIDSGSAHLSASGSYATMLDAEWNINVPDLEHLLPEGKGSLRGEGTVIGQTGYPHFTAEVTGGGISYDQYKAGDLAVNINIDTTDRDNSLIDIRAAQLLVSTREINSFSLKADGKIAAHTISLSAATDRQSLRLSADAGYHNEVWKGDLTEAALDLGDFGMWDLKQQTSFSLSSRASQTDNLCWTQDSASACLQTSWTGKEGLSLHAGLSNVPLSLFSTVAPSSLSLEGILEGSTDIRYDTGALHGNVSFTVPEGSVTYTSKDETPVTVTLEQARLDAHLNEEALDITVLLSLLEKGYVKGDVNLPRFTPLLFSTEDQTLSGHIQAELKALDLIPLFTSNVQNTKGTINSDLKVAGTLSDPTLTGRMVLSEGGAFIPELGINLENISAGITSNETGRLQIDGRLSSGKGEASLQGELQVKELNVVHAALNIKGDNFEAVRVPELWLVVSPDINVQLLNSTIELNGALLIPEALIEPTDLSGGVPVSQDVIIVSEDSETAAEERWTFNSSVKLELGDNVKFKGYGLVCRITGGIQLTDEPGKPTQSRGELQIVDGLYKAYGQDLSIEKGRLLFVGPTDDPGLDINAVRRIKDVRAGIRVSGTLQSPAMEVFSVPVMDQSDALSYILFGRPMNSLSSSEGQQLHSTATSAYLSGGGFIAKKIGAAFGLEEVEIEQEDTVQSSTLVLGKYLSPRLYVSYGIGLFEPINTLRMRYNLSRRWLLQTEYGVESGGDVLYQLEK